MRCRSRAISWNYQRPKVSKKGRKVMETNARIRKWLQRQDLRCRHLTWPWTPNSWTNLNAIAQSLLTWPALLLCSFWFEVPSLFDTRKNSLSFMLLYDKRWNACPCKCFDLPHAFVLEQSMKLDVKYFKYTWTLLTPRLQLHGILLYSQVSQALRAIPPPFSEILVQYRGCKQRST